MKTNETNFALSRLNQTSLCKPGSTAIDDEARRIEKYCELVDNEYSFQKVVIELLGSCGKSGENFVACLCKILCCPHDDQRAVNFLKQRFPMALQIGKAACVLGSVSDRDAFEEIYYKKFIF